MDFALLNAVSNLERTDGVIAIPGPDAYTLAARLDRPSALERILRITGARDTPLLLGRDIDALTPCIGCLPEKAFELMTHYWPGPLILMLSGSPFLPEPLAGRPCVKFMQPEQPLLLDLLALIPSGVLAVACAARAGDQPPGDAETVLNSFGDDVDFILADDDAVREASAPTMVRVDTDGTIHLLRSGRIVLD